MKYIPLVPGWVDIVYRNGVIIDFKPRLCNNQYFDLAFFLASDIKTQSYYSI